MRRRLTPMLNEGIVRMRLCQVYLILMAEVEIVLGYYDVWEVVGRRGECLTKERYLLLVRME